MTRCLHSLEARDSLTRSVVSANLVLFDSGRESACFAERTQKRLLWCGSSGTGHLSATGAPWLFRGSGKPALVPQPGGSIGVPRANPHIEGSAEEAQGDYFTGSHRRVSPYGTSLRSDAAATDAVLFREEAEEFARRWTVAGAASDHKQLSGHARGSPADRLACCPPRALVLHVVCAASTVCWGSLAVPARVE